mgnify:CR=1 FL=1
MFRNFFLFFYIYIIIIGCVDTGTKPNTPGCTDPDAINYNPLANVDDYSCHIAFIDIINGLYDNQTVTVQGVVVDYFDVTVYGGPHAITIEDENGYRIELVVWADNWDILDGNLCNDGESHALKQHLFVHPAWGYPPS